MGSCKGIDTVLDICVVGAGPHGLAFLTHFLSPPENLDRFDEHPNNSALYSRPCGTDRNRRRIKCKVADNANTTRSKRSGREMYEQYMSRAASSHVIKELRGLRVLHVESQTNEEKMCERVCVLDKCGDSFMRKWDTHFDVLDIPFLRSTTHQHPDPLDLGLLSSFAYHTKRHYELVPLNLTSNPEEDHKRNKAFRGPYLRPSRELFRDFIRGLVKGFRLEESVNCAHLQKLEAVVGTETRRITGFRLTYKRDLIPEQVVYAKRVILALGHANLLSIPEWATSLNFPAPKHCLLHYEDLIATLAMSESADVRQHFYALLNSEGNGAYRGPISAPLKGMRVLIVGGGQTSVHLAQLAVSKLGSNPRDITFLTRSALRSQPFDVSLDWLSTVRYESMANFWTLNYKQRQKILREAKGGHDETRLGSGASVDGECVKWLRSSGIDVREQCEVHSLSWTDFDRCGEWKVEFWDDLNDIDCELRCDLIMLATGNSTDFIAEPVVDSLRKSLMAHNLDIHMQGKLPVLEEDLSLQLISSECSDASAQSVTWDDKVGVHIMGAYAALELGPGALNLMGARAGASRISRSIRHLLD